MTDWTLLDSHENDKIKVRQFLSSCVNRNQLASLDEAIGTASTIATAGFGFLALFVEDLKPLFGVITFVTILFFWIGYRFAKIVHSIEYRMVIISSFIPFLVYVIITPIINIVPLADLFGYSIRMLPFILVLIITPKGIKRTWKWLTDSQFDDWSPWDSPIEEKASGKRETIARFVALYWYCMAIFFYGFAAFILTIVLSLSMSYMELSTVFAVIVVISVVIVAKIIIDSENSDFLQRIEIKKSKFSNKSLNS